MNWFQENRFLGMFLAALAAGVVACAVFVWLTKSSFDAAKVEFDERAGEMAVLQRHNPFPTETNLAKMKTHAEEYASRLEALKTELKTHVLPQEPLQPNELQARLNRTAASVGEKAKVSKVKLPDNFFLGFEEFATRLPDTAEAPLLGQQLAQTELLVNLLIDARVEAITALKRVPLTTAAAVPGASPAGTPVRKPNTPAAATAAANPLVERTTIETTFSGTPAAMRRVLNQIATANQQFFIIRTLHVVNEKEKGPPREAPGAAGATAATATGAPAAATNAALHFIVGNERVQTTARIELVRFTF